MSGGAPAETAAHIAGRAARHNAVKPPAANSAAKVAAVMT